MQQGDAQKDVRRVNVNFSPEIYDALQQIAEERSTTMADVLRDAIGLEKFVQDTKKEGGRILIDRGNGRTHELLR